MLWRHGLVLNAASSSFARILRASRKTPIPSHVVEFQSGDKNATQPLTDEADAKEGCVTAAAPPPKASLHEAKKPQGLTTHAAEDTNPRARVSESKKLPTGTVAATPGRRGPGHDAVEAMMCKLNERLIAMERRLIAGDAAVTQLQQQQGVIESHISGIEEAVNQLRKEHIEARRLVGDVLLRQQNMDLLVKQTERIVLRAEENVARIESARTAHDEETIDTQGCGLTEGNTVLNLTGDSQELTKALHKMVEDRFSEWMASHHHHTPGALAKDAALYNEETSAGQPQAAEQRVVPLATDAVHSSVGVGGDGSEPAAPILHGLQHRLANLELRIETIQAELSQRFVESAVTQRVLGVVCDPDSQSDASASQSCDPLHIKPAGTLDKDTASTDDSGGTSSIREACPSAAELAQLLRCAGVLPFKDATGLTRIASQRVLVCDVPANVGAAEVRELCANAVGGGKGVISCVVRRLPMHPAPGAMADEHQAEGHAAGRARDGTRYRSQQQQRVPPAGAGSDEALPGIGAPAPLRRGFEVTFASAQLAVRAIAVLDGFALKSGEQKAPQAIAVGPVVSADILAAVKRLEGKM